MNSKELSIGILRAIAILFGIALLGFLFYKLSVIIIYMIIALIFSLITNPFVQFLKNKLKFKNTLAVITTLLVFVVLFTGFVLLFVPLIIKQGQNLSLLDLNKLEENYDIIVQNVNEYLNSHNVNFKNLIESTSSSLNFNFIPNIFNTIINLIGNLGMGLASVIFISFFLLKEQESFFNLFKKLIPDAHEAKILDSLQKIKNLLTRYFIGLLLQLSIILVLYLIVFLIFGIENAFIIALLCAVLNIIPYVGPLLATIVASVLIMLSGIDADFVNETIPTMLYVLIGMFVVQLIDNNVSQPVIFSKSTNSHPLEIFIVILASGILFGITGMIIAVPAYTVLKVIGKSFLPNNKIIKALTKGI